MPALGGSHRRVHSASLHRHVRPQHVKLGTLTESSLGSGVVLSEDGYIVTNNHVVVGADALKVTVGGEEYDADVVGTDESSDIAVIKLRNASGLTPSRSAIRTT